MHPIAPNWLFRHQLRHWSRDSLWLFPVVAMVAALICGRLLVGMEQTMGWRSTLSPDGARTVLGTLAASMFTFIVFLSSVLLLAVQLASAQLTPRIIAFLFRDPVIKLAMAAFVFTFTFTLAVLLRIRDSVPLLAATSTAYACLASLGIFLYLIAHIGRSLRASGALRSIGAVGRGVIHSVYPRLVALADPPPVPDIVPAGPPRQTVCSQRYGAVLAFDTLGLFNLGVRFDCTIEIVPQVGDFVAFGDPLFRVFGAAADVPVAELQHSIAIGPERTFELDPALALRVIVDIACKALSPAVNDPTTAVLALDEIHHLLRALAHRNLNDRVLKDAAGKHRLVFHTPDWEDFVNLAVTEIRHYGGGSIQVVRRLRAMLENLVQTLPASRAALLRVQLALLRRSSERCFPEPEDQALAAISDPQGVGGRHENHSSQPSPPP